LLLAISNILSNGLDQYFVMVNAQNISKVQGLDYYVFNIGYLQQGYSEGTAIGILKSLISLALLFGANYAAKKIRGRSIV